MLIAWTIELVGLGLNVINNKQQWNEEKLKKRSRFFIDRQIFLVEDGQNSFGWKRKDRRVSTSYLVYLPGTLNSVKCRINSLVSFFAFLVKKTQRLLIGICWRKNLPLLVPYSHPQGICIDSSFGEKTQREKKERHHGLHRIIAGCTSLRRSIRARPSVQTYRARFRCWPIHNRANCHSRQGKILFVEWWWFQNQNVSIQRAFWQRIESKGQSLCDPRSNGFGGWWQ